MNLTDQPVRQRMPRQKDPAYLRSFRGKACEGCGRLKETVVPAHVTDERYSLGAKPDDKYTVALCKDCHDILDRRVIGDREKLLARIVKSLCAERHEAWKDQKR